MKMLTSAFARYWLGEVGPGTSLTKNGFPEMFDLRLFFPFLVHVQGWVLCSCLKSLAGEMLIYRSIPALRQEWD